MKAIISGGGSGGHIYPAISIADEIKRRFPSCELLFVGAKNKMEMEKVPKAGYPIKGLWISGFQRKLTMRNLTFPFKLIHSLWKARKILRQFNPDVVIGVGGFASGPVLKMAQSKGIPTLIQEQNSFPGITNRLLAGKVNKICVAYKGMDHFFPKEKIILTGNPVRRDIVELEDKKDLAVDYFKWKQGVKTLLMFGGSLGAKSLNVAIRENADFFKAHPEIEFMWQAGKLYIDEFKQCETAKLPNVHIMPFIDRMDLAYALADLVICRAGALTISELCIAKKAAILVPSPNVAENHQYKNAMALVSDEAAVVVEDKHIEEKLFKAIANLLNEKDQLETLKKNIEKLAKVNAATNIVDEITTLVK